MMGWNGEPGWAGWLLMSVGMVAFWVLVALAVVALLPGVKDDRAHHRGRRSGGMRRTATRPFGRSPSSSIVGAQTTNSDAVSTGVSAIDVFEVADVPQAMTNARTGSSRGSSL